MYRKIMLTLGLLLVGSLMGISPSEARHYHHHYRHHVAQAQSPFGFGETNNMGSFFQPQQQYTPRHQRQYSEASREVSGARGVIGGRPSGCPNAFCGCEASLYLFGKIVPHLNLAANWFRFPRSAPAPRTVAVRNHHVMVLVAQVDGDKWLVHDGNSGGHKTREHVRSIRGYSIHSPSA